MIERTFDVSDKATIQVSIASGRVEVREGPSHKVSVSVDTDDPDFRVEQSGDTIIVKSSKNSSRFFSKGSIVTVDAPHGSGVIAATASADVDLRVNLGNVEVSTASGDIRFQTADELDAKVASGDIHGDAVNQRCKVASASGDIAIGSLTGRATCSAASGDMLFKSVERDATFNTASGDIAVGTFTGDTLECRSMSGSVIVGVLPRTKVELDVTTLSGDVRLPTSKTNQEAPLRHVTIKAKLVSGDLVLNRVE